MPKKNLIDSIFDLVHSNIKLKEEMISVARAARKPKEPIWTEIVVAFGTMGIVLLGIIPLYWRTEQLDSKSTQEAKTRKEEVQRLSENLDSKTAQERGARKEDMQRLDAIFSKRMEQTAKTMLPYPQEAENSQDLPQPKKKIDSSLPLRVKGKIVFSKESRPQLYNETLSILISDFSSNIIKLNLEELFKYEVFEDKTQLTPAMKDFFNTILQSDLTIYNRKSRRLELPGFSYSSLDGTVLKWGMDDA